MILAFLTDYGPGTEHVGALHAVAAAAAPGAERLDLAHDVEPGDVRWGAILLARLSGLLPAGAVVVAVVDPGVGTGRRGLVVTTPGGVRVVGPDNGLLGLLGAGAAHELTAEAHRRHPVSATFHGRDVFAPAGAHLAAGGEVADLGPGVDPASVVRPRLPAPYGAAGRVEAMTVGRDRFGNLSLWAGPEVLEAAGMRPGDRVWVLAGAGRQRAAVGVTFADVPRGGLLVHVDSHGLVALAVNGGSALERVRAAPGEVVALEAMAGP
ncbi:MAG: SAM-dependent chlorinase/fluorinase [Thermoleophilia bacterium]|nr:SAM-dependent chlorinase/fluorinase [Thermoleophilia bacterium]